MRLFCAALRQAVDNGMWSSFIAETRNGVYQLGGYDEFDRNNAIHYWLSEILDCGDSGACLTETSPGRTLNGVFVRDKCHPRCSVPPLIAVDGIALAIPLSSKESTGGRAVPLLRRWRCWKWTGTAAHSHCSVLKWIRGKCGRKSRCLEGFQIEWLAWWVNVLYKHRVRGCWRKEQRIFLVIANEERWRNRMLIDFQYFKGVCSSFPLVPSSDSPKTTVSWQWRFFRQGTSSWFPGHG